jgi:hypothetical protein
MICTSNKKMAVLCLGKVSGKSKCVRVNDHLGEKFNGIPG